MFAPPAIRSWHVSAAAATLACVALAAYANTSGPKIAALAPPSGRRPRGSQPRLWSNERFSIMRTTVA